MTSKNKIGIFGGAFDPVHNGHLIVSMRAIEELELELLYVVPTYLPPHKDSGNLSSYELRTGWLDKVFENVKEVVVSDYERERGVLSYSLYTVRHFARKHRCVPYLVVGEDSYRSFESWYEYETLLEEARLVVYPRFSQCETLDLREGVIFLEAPRVEFSSTQIRERVKLKKSVLGMVPECIASEVVQHYA